MDHIMGVLKIADQQYSNSFRRSSNLCWKNGHWLPWQPWLVTLWGKRQQKRSLFPLLRNKAWLQACDTVNIGKERRRISDSPQVPVTLQAFHACSFCLEKPKESPFFFQVIWISCVNSARSFFWSNFSRNYLDFSSKICHISLQSTLLCF